MNDTERLERIYNVAARELRRMLYSLEGSKYTAMAAGAAHNRALEITRVLNVAVDNWAGEAIPRAYKKGAAVARTALEILGKKPRRPPFEDKRRRLQDDLVILLIKANNSIPTIVDRYLASAMMAERAVQGAQLQEFSFDDVKDDVEAMAKKAVQAEASRGELSRTVRDYLRDQIGQGEFLEIKGRTYKMNNYAELVGRTTMRDAQTAATLDLCHQYENDLVQVSSHGTVCEICAQYEGKVYSISGKTLGYPILDAKTPFHPNCEHSLLPTSPEAIAEEKGALEPSEKELSILKSMTKGQGLVDAKPGGDNFEAIQNFLEKQEAFREPVHRVIWLDTERDAEEFFNKYLSKYGPREPFDISALSSWSADPTRVYGYGRGGFTTVKFTITGKASGNVKFVDISRWSVYKQEKEVRNIRNFRARIRKFSHDPALGWQIELEAF